MEAGASPAPEEPPKAEAPPAEAPPPAAEPPADAPAAAPAGGEETFDGTVAERLRPRLTEEQKAALQAEKELEKQKQEALLELPKTPTPDLKALVVAGICKPAKDCLCVRWKGKQATADLLLDGSVFYRGECYPTLSPFSKEAHNRLRKECGDAPRLAYNGWSTVFYLVRAPDDWVVITQLREQLYAVEAAQEAEANAKAVEEAIERERETAKRAMEDLAASNRGPTAGGKELADALIPPLNRAFSEKAVKAAFLRRDKKALMDSIAEAAAPGFLEVLSEFRRGTPAQMKALCKEVEALMAKSAGAAVDETLRDEGAILDDLAEEVLDRCKDTFLPFCVELKERPNEAFAQGDGGGKTPAGAAAAAAPGKPANGGDAKAKKKEAPPRRGPSASSGQRAAGAAGRKKMAEAETYDDLSDQLRQSSSESESDDDDSDSGRKKRKKGAKKKGKSGGGGGSAKKKSKK